MNTQPPNAATRGALARWASFSMPALLLACAIATPLAARAAGQEAGACKNASSMQGVAALVCGDPALATLDHTLSRVYAQAARKSAKESLPLLKTGQQAWALERDACAGNADPRACLDTSYRRRIAELQARHRLLPPIATVRYACEGAGAEVVATYFRTEPPVLLARRGAATAVMFAAPSGSGARYVGRHESLWEHQGEALIQWGEGAPEWRCKKRP